jgi:alpha-tubulin suppressor-like RCC1 family protein
MKRFLPALFLSAACGAGLVDHGGVDLQTVGGLQCRLPQQDCGGAACVSPETDVNNCGTCGLVCATPQHSTSKCEASTCGFTCNPGFFQCASQGCCPAGALAAGGDTSCAVVDGTVQCWGSNSSGQLGVDSGPAPFSATPVTVPGVGAASSVAVGLNHVCAIRAGTGEVVCWGSNLSQQLGASGTGIVPVPGISGAQLLALGDRHSCAVTATGISCWGANESGQLGQGSFTSPLGPGAVTGLAGASSLSAGSAFTCAVTSGALNCWGDGSLGQFGNGAATASSTPVPVGVSGPTIVATGGAHACSIRSGSSILCWGFDSFGQVGDGKQSSIDPSRFSGPGMQSPSIVAAGREHTCAVSDAGAAFCWGSNVSGQLGIGFPVAVETKPVALSGLAAGVQRLALGATHSCAQTADGAVYCWGNNGSGQAAAPVGGTLLAPRPID